MLCHVMLHRMVDEWVALLASYLQLNAPLNRINVNHIRCVNVIGPSLDRHPVLLDKSDPPADGKDRVGGRPMDWQDRRILSRYLSRPRLLLEEVMATGIVRFLAINKRPLHKRLK